MREVSAATAAGANNPPAPKGDPTRGRELFQTSGCRSCHQLDVDDEHKAPALGELLVSEALNKGWALYGDPTYAFDAANGVMRCGQAVTKDVDGTYTPDVKLGEQ